MALIYNEYTLNEAAVEAVSAELQTYLNRQGAERKSIQRLRLTVEEILLNIKANCGGNQRISVGIGKQFGRHLLRLRYTSAPYDPTKPGEDEWAYSLMRGMGHFPSWNYKGRTNTVSLQLRERPKRGALFSILLAVLAAALVGSIGGLLQDGLRVGLDKILLTPISQGFLGLMGTFSGLMIAFTICSGVLNVGDTVTFGRMGRYILSRFVSLSFAVCAVVVALVMPLLRLNHSGIAAEQSSQLGQISRMIFEILPSNPVDPFLTGNAMQIIVIALLLGIGLLSIGERGSAIRELVDEGATLTQHTVALICGMIPLFVFVMLLRQFWSGQMRTLLSIWKPLLLIVCSELLITAMLWLLTALRLKCPAMLLLKKVLPPFIVAFTTASSMSAMTLGMETCKSRLGVRENVVSFAYPLGTVIYMPASIASFTVIALVFAEIYQVEVNLSWMIAVLFTVTLLVIAMPPIPGAGLLVYTILFARLGIPAEALVLATAIDVAVDYCNTGFNVLLLVLQIAYQGKSLDSMDLEILMNRGDENAV